MYRHGIYKPNNIVIIFTNENPCGFHATVQKYNISPSTLLKIIRSVGLENSKKIRRIKVKQKFLILKPLLQRTLEKWT